MRIGHEIVSALIALGRMLLRARRHSDRRLMRRLQIPAAQQGQSLTELAVLTPILVLSVLGAVNLGLALQAHTALAQATQQAAQYLLNHHASTSCGLSTNTYQSCTEKQVADYLSTHAFSCAAADGGSTTSACTVTVTFGTMTVGGQYELIGTISVKDQFSLAVPIPGQLNSGPLHGNSITLNAQVATVLPTDAPTISGTPTPLYDAGNHFTGYKITWTAPQAASAGATISYRIYSYNTAIAVVPSTSLSYTDLCASPTNEPACAVTPTQHYSYQVSAVQPNGMESALSAPVQSS